MMWRCLVVLASAVSALGCAQTASVEVPNRLAPGRYTETLEFGGKKRTFIARIPEASRTRPVPVVVVLHGWTASGLAAEAYTQMAREGEKRGYLTIFPDGLGDNKGWNADFLDLSGHRADDAAFVIALLDWAGKQVAVDPNRLYVCGHSNGGMLSHLVGARFGDRIAAIGVVAGTSGVNGRRIPDPKNPVSVLIVHAIPDRTVAFARNSEALLKGDGAEEAAELWRKAIGAPETAISTDRDGVWRRIWAGGRDGTTVELVALRNGTHAWPGGIERAGVTNRAGYEAAQELLDFFDRHPKRRP
jgi:polyhydroxybutyrate depolymerase